MRSAKPIDTRTALQIYFNYPNEIGNAELRELFDVAAQLYIGAAENKNP